MVGLVTEGGGEGMAGEWIGLVTENFSYWCYFLFVVMVGTMKVVVLLFFLLLLSLLVLLLHLNKRASCKGTGKTWHAKCIKTHYICIFSVSNYLDAVNVYLSHVENTKKKKKCWVAMSRDSPVDILMFSRFFIAMYMYMKELMANVCSKMKNINTHSYI